jgi:hypothetical protein
LASLASRNVTRFHIAPPVDDDDDDDDDDGPLIYVAPAAFQTPNPSFD